MKKYLVLAGILVLSLGFVSFFPVLAEDLENRIGQELGPEGSPTALELAGAILTPSTAPLLISATRTGMPAQFEVYTISLQGFPTDGSSWALISTGKASNIAGTATTFYSYNTAGPTSPPYSHRGYPSYDIATLTLFLSVPPGATTLSFDWKFGTEENPTYIGSYVDWARAIVTTSAGPTNILLFPDGKPVDVDRAVPFSNKVTGSSTWPLPPYPSPNDVVYNAVTGTYKATFNVAPFVGETIRIDFQVADENDQILDSALFIDNLNIEALPQPEKWSFAIITDLHIGRGYLDYCGEGTGWEDEGINLENVDEKCEDYYLTERLKKVVNWINENKNKPEYNIDFLVILGDITDSAERGEFLKAKKILDRLNDPNGDEDISDGIPYIPVFGNHDVWPYTDFEEAALPSGENYFDEIFWDENSINMELLKERLDFQKDEDNPKYKNFAFNYKEINFLGLDFLARESILGLGKGVGADAVLWPSTLNWLRENLHEDQPTIIFSHQPFINDSFVAFQSSEIDDIDEIIKDSKVKIKANFAGHVHGYYDPSKIFNPLSFDSKRSLLDSGLAAIVKAVSSPIFVNANNNYKEEGFSTPADIPVVTTEAFMVASNESTPKGIIRIVKVESEGIDYDTIEGEFRSLNPYLKEIDVEARPGFNWPPSKWVKWVIEVEAYAFAKRFTEERPGAYILEVDSEKDTKQSENWENAVQFEFNFDGEKYYHFNLTTEGYTPEGELIRESINQTIKLKRPGIFLGGFSPVDITVTDPDGLTLNKQLNEIPGATYSEDTDYNGDEELDDIIIIPDRKTGDYLINIMPQPDADPIDTYTILVWPETEDEPFVLVENIQISNIPTQPYIVRSTETEIIPIIPATIDFDPDTLNIESKGQWVAVYIELPVGHGYDVSMIDLASTMLNGEIQAEVKPTEIGDYDGDSIPDLMVKFNRSVVQNILQIGDKIKITITGNFTGNLIDGRLFEGTDFIRVISP